MYTAGDTSSILHTTVSEI